MKSLILPLILTILGTGAGIGVGLFVVPPPVEEESAAMHDCPDPEAMMAAAIPDITEEREYAKLNNQFVIPVVEEEMVAALVVMSLNLEVTVGSTAAIFSAEPKLRDRFLQVMFNHANTGGFSGNFTSGTNMRILRNELLSAAQEVSGDRVTDVLVIDLVRQDS